MKKLISVLSFVLLLVFSCVLTSFASNGVVSGYAVENVPYNESFEGVLTSSDSGSQLYSSADNRTYNTSSVLSAPSTSSSSLFTAHSITDMIPSNIWRSNNSANTTTFPVDNGYTGVSIAWNTDSNPNTVYHQKWVSERSMFKFFRANRKYRFSFNVYCPMNSKGTFDFYLADVDDMNTPIVKLFHNNAPVSGGGNLWVKRAVTIEYVCPDDFSAVLIPVVRANIYGLQFACYINDFTITDITTEDLDKSLDKLGDRLENSINPSVPYNKFDDGSFKDSANELKEAENALPTVDFNVIDELSNSVNVSSYSQAFASINQLFIRVVDTIGLTPLIFFACFFGFCIFLIGRKLSGG